ncbi:MAG TPA: terminase gpA endonuclease subunit [Novosphingobium sp.]|nr:terminase gpA endonuclease subunit [Novosphingobium sp.]
MARLAHRLRPKEKLTLSQWAAKFMPKYDPGLLPFLDEVMDACSDPETGEVGDMGPSQGGKSLVGEAFIGFSIHQEPQPFLMTQPDKIAAETFIKLRVNALMDSMPVLKAELAPGVSSDNMHLKLFKSGVYLGAAWPVKSHFRGRPYCRGWLDDFDAISADIEGEGDAVGLLESRFAFFKGQDTKLVSSSPAKEKGGIEAFVAAGTDERLQPVCPDCGDRIELDTIRDLKFELGGDAELAAETAHVVCPANGCILEPEARHELLRSLKELPRRGFVAHNRSAGTYRRTFRRDGLLSLNSWDDLARQWRAAQIAWDDLQDEGPLRTFYNTKAGKNYRSKLSGEKPIESTALRDRRENGWLLGTVPRGPVVLVLVIDVQHDRFECAVVGTATGRETWLVDRFAVDVLDDGLTGLAPFVHKEHWRVLLPLFDRRYPMMEGGRKIGEAPILSVTIDTGGSDKAGDQATEGAKFFWQEARAAGIKPNRITLVKGGSNINGQLMPTGQFADKKTKGGARKTSARLWIPNVHKIKNMIDARLRRTVPGPGYIHLPEDLTEEHLDELTAEEIVKGKWAKRRTRNETWDLLVYAEAAILRPPFAQSKPHMRWVPRGFRIEWPAVIVATEEAEGEDQPDAPATPAAETAPPATRAPQAPAKPAPKRARNTMTGQRRGDWLKRRK